MNKPREIKIPYGASIGETIVSEYLLVEHTRGEVIAKESRYEILIGPKQITILRDTPDDTYATQTLMGIVFDDAARGIAISNDLVITK